MRDYYNYVLDAMTMKTEPFSNQCAMAGPPPHEDTATCKDTAISGHQLGLLHACSPGDTILPLKTYSLACMRTTLQDHTDEPLLLPFLEAKNSPLRGYIYA